MAIPKPPTPHDPECRYIKKVERKWEFGVVTRKDIASKPTHTPLGVCKTYEEALIANNMALRSVENTPYRGPSCSGGF